MAARSAGFRTLARWADMVAGRPLLGRPYPRRREADALRLPNAEVDAAGRRLHRRQPCLVARWSFPLLQKPFADPPAIMRLRVPGGKPQRVADLSVLDQQRGSF